MQRAFANFPVLEYAAPVVTVDTAAVVLGLTTEKVEGAIDDGKLTAFDIGTSAERRELRILSASVAAWKEAGADGDFLCPFEPAEAVRLVLDQAGEKWIEGRKLARALRCSSTLIMEHIAARRLAVVNGTSWSRGWANSPRLKRESVESWLQKRIAA